MAIYMQVTKDDIKGTATEENHVDWMAMEECNFTVQREVNTEQGNVVDRSNKQPHFDDLELTKYSDIASPKLMEWMIKGATHQVTIHFCKEDSKTPFMEYILEDVLLSEYTIEGSEDDRPKDKLKIDYAQITFKYTPFDAKNNPDSSKEEKAGYDLIAGKSKF